MTDFDSLIGVLGRAGVWVAEARVHREHELHCVLQPGDMIPFCDLTCGTLGACVQRSGTMVPA